MLGLSTPAVMAQAPTPSALTGSPSTDAFAAVSPLLPDDSKLVRGKLANGMDYLIYPLSNPKGQVNFWLQIHAGSLQEEEDQRGIAHFVEHMLFNGTKDYPANQVIETFEKVGLKFGADVNAYTTYHETVFQVNMPTKNQAAIDTVMNIFKNWAGSATFDKHEVEDERGVIIEEWRSNQGLKWRNGQKQRAYTLEGSRHFARETIGDMAIIRSVPADKIKAYYDKWYQPQNMTFIVTGDVNPDEIIPQINKTFADLANRTAVQPKVEYKMPAIPQSRFTVIADSENSSNSFMLIYRYPKIFMRSHEDFAHITQYNILLQLFNQRMQNKIQNGELPDILGSMVISSQLGEDYQGIYFRATAKNDDIGRAATVLLTELARIDRYGFTQNEWALLKRTQLAHLENAAINADSRDARMLTARIADVSSYHLPFLAPQTRYELTKSVYDQLDLSQINHNWQTLIRHLDDKIYEQIINSKLTENALSADQITNIEKQVAHEPLKPYQFDVKDKPLLDPSELTEGDVTRQASLTDNMTELTLSNGAKVIIYPTQFDDKKVSLVAIGDQGALNFTDQNYHAVKLANSVVNSSGLGDLSTTELKSWLANNFANINTAVLERNATISVMGNQDKLEPLFQLIHARFTRTKVNPEIWQVAKQAQEHDLDALDNQPKSKFKQLSYQMRFDDERAGVMNRATLEQLTPNTLLALDKQLFANPANFTFMIVGNVNIDEVKQLSERYLASLMADKSSHDSKIASLTEPASPIVELKRHNQDTALLLNEENEPYAQVSLLLTHRLDQPVTEQDRQALLAFNFALNRDLRVEIREKSSGAYSVSTITSLNPLTDEFTFKMAFSCDPKRYQALFTRAQEVVKQRVEKGITQAELDEYKQMQLRAIAVQKNNNAQILRLMLTSYLTYHNLSLYNDIEQTINHLTVEVINHVSQREFNHTNYRYSAILLPKKGVE